MFTRHTQAQPFCTLTRAVTSMVCGFAQFAPLTGLVRPALDIPADAEPREALGGRRIAKEPLATLAFFSRLLMPLMIVGAPALLTAQTTQIINLDPLVNADLTQYTNGNDYPQHGGNLSISGVPFTLSTIAPNSDTAIIDSASGGAQTTSIPVNLTGITTVFTLINSQYGTCDSPIGELDFVGATSGTFVYSLTEGVNVRDHNESFFCNTATDLAGTASFGGGQVRLDMQRIALPDSFANDTLVSITFIIYGPDSTPGLPFVAAITVAGDDIQAAKLLGDCACKGSSSVRVASPAAGDPIDVASGNVFYSKLDYTTSGQNPLSFTRYYNSAGNAAGTPPFAASLATDWRSTYDRYLHVSSSQVIAERQDGRQLTFKLAGGKWTTDSDVDDKLVQSGTKWTYTDQNDNVESYTMIGSGKEALLETIVARNGYKQTLKYNGSNQLVEVTDSYGRTLTFAYYSVGLLEAVTTADNTVLTYGYIPNPSGIGALLDFVLYPTTPVTGNGYIYGVPSNPSLLTTVNDELGNAYATWTYDAFGRGLTSQLASGANLETVTYDDDNGSRTVTNALGVTDTYSFKMLQGIPKVTKISRAKTTTTAAASETVTYDTNGFLASLTDWNGNATTYVNNSHGQPTTITEAVGSSAARTTTLVYDPKWVHLPATITTPGLTATFVYDGSGELLTKTLTDTTDTSSPYSTKGQARTWTNTWFSHLLASAETPNGNKTSFGYDGTGALTSITDPLSQVTKITSHTGGGLPETVVDPNGVTTTLKYSPRQWLTSSTVSGSGGTFTTNFTYDFAGNLILTTLPDNSYSANLYDSAHRLTAIINALGEFTAFELDPLGDRTATGIYESNQTLTLGHGGVFDDLGRLLTDISGAGQLTAFSYDPNGNPLTATDSLGHETKSSYDALNRLNTVTDANGGITTTAYDTHDRIISVKDANGHITSYVRDGFGDVIQQTSPDSGKTVYHYDLDGNLTQKVDAAGVITDHTYDALDRTLTTTYPADSAENVAFTYDQTGHGFGIGRLTSVKDAAGMLSRTYDERGNLLSDKRVHGSVTLTTSYTYDPASRIASITYPSGNKVTYSRDSAGQVTKITTPTATVASGITHLPFGPVNAFTYGNGIADARSFDYDYRMTGLKDSANSTSAIQSLVYAYDAANNLKTITDSVHTKNSQTIGYDALNRLTSATATEYGTFSYTYDKLGNRLTEGRGSAATTTDYSYVAGTNRLSSLKLNGGTLQTFAYTATGNMLNFTPSGGTLLSYTYNNANRVGTIAKNGTQIAQYLYDGFGQRLVKNYSGTPAAGTLFAYSQDGSLLEETNIIGKAQADYIYLDGMPIGDYAPGTKTLYYLHTDHLGTPQLATNSVKAIEWQAIYEPFGWQNTVSGTITQNLRMPGQYFDSETTSYHNGFRDYVAILGRYGQSDPIGLMGGINAYAYASGNPQISSDLLGLSDTSEGLNRLGSLNMMVGGLLLQFPLPNIYSKMAGASLVAVGACLKATSTFLEPNKAPFMIGGDIGAKALLSSAEEEPPVALGELILGDSIESTLQEGWSELYQGYTSVVNSANNSLNAVKAKFDYLNNSLR